MAKTEEEQKKRKRRKIVFLSSFFLAMLLVNSQIWIDSIIQYQNYCADNPSEIVKQFPDFFYYLAFVKTIFTSQSPYFDSIPQIQEYFCGGTIGFSFSYPPNILLFISHLQPIEKFLGFNGLIYAVFAINIIVCLVIGWLIAGLWEDSPILAGKSKSIKFLVAALLILSSNFCLIALTSGQVSVFFTLALTLFVYQYLKGHSFRSGLLLSLFIIKPQIGLLFGLFSLRNLRSFLGALTGLVISSAYAILLTGPYIFQDYYNSFFVEQNKKMFFLAKQSIALPSILYKDLHLTNQGNLIIIQAIFIAIAVSTCFLIFKKDTNLTIKSKLGLLILLNILMTPYCLMYDYLTIIPGLLLLATQFYKDKIFLILVAFLSFGNATAYIKIFGPTSDAWIYLCLLTSYLVIFKSSLIMKKAKNAK